MTPLRWHIRHYGTNYDDWSVYENPGGGHTEPFPSILSWLTEPQAKATADFLNDVCGYNWQQRHPDWDPRTKGQLMSDENQYLSAFARNVRNRQHSSIQDPHWRMLYHPDDISGDKLTIEAITPHHTVQSVMELLLDAISRQKGNR